MLGLNLSREVCVTVLRGIASVTASLANLPADAGGPNSPLRIRANLRKLTVRNSENQLICLGELG